MKAKVAPVVAILLALCAAYAVAEGFVVSWPERVQLMQGEITELKVTGTGLSAVEGLRGKEAIHFYAVGPESFAGIIGADLEAKPGTAKIFLKAVHRDGSQRRLEINLTILPKAFRQEAFTVAEQFDQLSAEALELIRIERADFAAAFSGSSAQRLWESPFIAPVPHESSSSFGYRRIINGKPRAPHSGADLRSPVGTEVRATNHGRVVLVGDYFFAGKSVVLDHGGSLYTMYFHLSKFTVKTGAVVRRGDIIGLSGASGRVTGPHLHWGARLGNARVDPFDLIRRISSSTPLSGES